MSLDKAILHKKEHRKPYHDCRAFDKSCRNHGSDPYDACSREYRVAKREPAYDPEDQCDIDYRIENQKFHFKTKVKYGQVKYSMSMEDYRKMIDHQKEFERRWNEDPEGLIQEILSDIPNKK
jgi:hypothetical protein